MVWERGWSSPLSRLGGKIDIRPGILAKPASSGPTSWGAYVPDPLGVISVGDAREEAERLFAEDIQFHLEVMRDEELEIPPPSSFAGSVEIHSRQVADP